MKTDAQLTWIEGNAPYSKRFEDRYFSREDGRAETREVFLAGNGLPQRWREAKQFHIAELGFGTGLNFLETLALWQKQAPPTSHLTFTSFELYPLSRYEIARALLNWPELSALATPLLDHWPIKKTRPFAPLQFAPLQFDNVTLELITGDAGRALPDWPGKADAWYLDGFSPAKNPQLWEADLMHSLYEHTNNNGTFSTYTAAGFVRRNLQQAGFEVQRVKGFGNKRERLQGVKGTDEQQQLIIKKAQMSDLQNIQILLRETWHATYDPVFGPAKTAQLFEHWHSLEKLAKRLQRPDTLMLVARCHGQLVATGCTSQDTMGATGKTILSQMYVKPGQQRTGIGSTLFARLLALSPEKNSIELEVEPDNKPAIAFYERHGFKITGELDDCGNTGHLVKALIMTRNS